MRRLRRHASFGSLPTLSFVLVSLAGLATGIMAGCAPTDPDPYGLEQPNLLVVLTDDQRWDTLWAMPFVTERMVANGTNFVNAIVTTPECCPFRGSYMSGGYYARDTGVLTNHLPNGGMLQFDDTNSLAVQLQRAGYRTGFIGKYFNNYETSSRILLKRRQLVAEGDTGSAYIPPGFDLFLATSTQQRIGDAAWTDYLVARGSSTADASTIGDSFRTTQYVTDYHTDQALDFLDCFGQQPFYLRVATHAPHLPAIPAEEDLDDFTDFVYRGRAFGEDDLRDKPVWMRNRGTDDTFRDRWGDRLEVPRRQLRTLLAVDRGVEALVTKLEELGVLDNTIVVFASDNGMLWGEHRAFGKNQPYEESIRVPLVILYPGGRRVDVEELVAVNLDLPATLLDYAGISTPNSAGGVPRPENQTPKSYGGEGLSLRGLIAQREQPQTWSRELLIERYGDPVWAGLRRIELQNGRVVANWKYVESAGHHVEYYDLIADPYEEFSKHEDPDLATDLAALHERLGEARGISLRRPKLPDARVGSVYLADFDLSGGVAPLTWRIRGELPPGLEFDEDKAFVQGTPTRAGSYPLVVRVSDSSTRRYTGVPREYVREYQIDVSGR